MIILIGVDGSPSACAPCELVASRAWPVGTRVTMLGAVEPEVDWTGLAPPSPGGLAAEIAALELILDERAAVLRRAGLPVEVLVEVGHAADLLVARAAEMRADLVVVGSRGLGPAGSAVLGSVSAHLVDHAPCPVLVARSGEVTRAVLATDGTPSSRDIPHILAAWGDALRGVPIEVLSVAAREGLFLGPGPEERAYHAEVARQTADQLIDLGWHAAATTREGEPSRQIVEEGTEWRADLIITGSRGIGTLHRLVAGSVAHDVLMHARASVLVMRGHVPARVPLGAVAAASLV